MLLTYSKQRKAIQYNCRRGYDEKLIEQIQQLVGANVVGAFDRPTVLAVALWQQVNGLVVDGKIGTKTLPKMKKGFQKKADDPPTLDFLIKPDTSLKPVVLDRVEKGRKALRRKSLDTNQRFKGNPRPASDVTGITFHQMAFSRGNDVGKYDKVTAHYTITPDGVIAQIHDIATSLWSSNALNRFTMAVEFAGNFRNSKGLWGGKFAPNHVTPEQVAAGRHLLKHVSENHGIKRVYAHVQGRGAGRANCCGPELWKNIAQWAIGAGGLLFEDTTTETYGKGWPIPAEWQ